MDTTTSTTEGVSSISSPATLESYFSRSQLALALAIQKSKPEYLSTAEYCQQLKKHIKLGEPTPHDEVRYVDSVEFWKDQYTQIRLQNKELEERIRYLENLQEFSHSGKSGNSESMVMKQNIWSLSTSIAPEKSHSSDSLSLGQKAERTSEDRGSQNFLIDDPKLKLHTYVLRIGRQRTELEKSISGSGSLEHVNDLARQILQVLKAIDQVLSNSCHSFLFIKTSTQDSQISNLMSRLMGQISMSFLSCFKAFNELSTSVPGRGKRDEIIYRMVMFFNQSLESLHTISLEQAEHVASSYSNPCSMLTQAMDEEYIVSKSLVNCLISILKSLDWKVDSTGHSDLLEGILFSILKHTGRLVSEAVFLEHVATSDNPGNMTKGIPLNNQKPSTFETRYVVEILHAALGGTNKKLLITEVLAAKNCRPSHSHSTQTYLSSKASLSYVLLLLQSTLVKSAVGGSHLESFRMPTPPAEEAEITFDKGLTVKEYGSEWLLENVWTMIGWDLVA